MVSAGASKVGSGALLRQVTSSEGKPTRTVSEPELQIMNAAMVCFAKTGYAATTMREIGATAGVTGAMVNYYFGSKEALYVRIAELTFAALGEHVDTALEVDVVDWQERLRLVVHAYLDFMVEYWSGVEFILDSLYGSPGGHPPIDVKKMHEKMEVRTRKVVAADAARGGPKFRKGYGPSDAVEFILLMLQYVTGRCSGEGRRPTKQIQSELHERLDHMLSPVLLGLCDADGSSSSRSKASSGPQKGVR
jgi:AcrR family transcriptional regulator